ncbi:LysR family transcriptional regulator [Acuticoccus kandeliae]|uniref:LysR family transcriptional regulator n=1 Tax=Acuticoccus kandeliae TaxID=2073160 RepID=UPI000D3EDEC9|nr:LysR family transcriptional regulator [Acuticoccus kandeliae]
MSGGYDLRALEVFAAVADLRSMTQAAQRLGMTQPAVSQAVRNLEEKLGVQLLDRSRRPLVLSAAGEWLQRTATQILGDAAQIALTIRQFGEGQALRLRVGLVDSLSDPFVPEMVKQLSPSVYYLSITSGLARTLRYGLIERSIDLIITNDPIEDLPEGVHIPIFTEPYFLVLPEAFDAGALDLAALVATRPFIRWSARSSMGADIDRHFRRLRLDLRRQYEFESARTILGMVAADLGWAVMTPLSVFDLIPVLGRVQLVPVPGPQFRRTLSVVATDEQYAPVARQIGQIAGRILRRSYVPHMIRAAPWLQLDVSEARSMIRLQPTEARQPA